MNIRDDLKNTITQVNHTKDLFYQHALRLHIHPFFEFAGMMSIWAKMVEDNAKNFTDDELKFNWGVIENAEDHQIKYLAEKFDCVFGTLFRDAKNREIFLKEMGWKN